MAFVIGNASEIEVRTDRRSADGRRFDDHIYLMNIPRFRPDFMDEPSIPDWLDYAGPLPWERMPELEWPHVARRRSIIGG
jgi:hypothetical protein